LSVFSIRGDARVRAVRLLHPDAVAYKVTVPSPTAMELRRRGSKISIWLGISGFYAALAAVDGRILLYGGGAQPTLVADLEVESIGEDLFDNGAANGTWLPAVVITTIGGGKPLGFFPREAGLIPDAGKVRAIAAVLRGDQGKK
jgi:hypothetical protein